MGENIADHGGLQISYQAFKKATADAPLAVKDGFTPEQRFFLAYANVWAGNVRPEEILKRTKSDPHSLGKWRVDGALPHIQAWYDAFGIKEGDNIEKALKKYKKKFEKTGVVKQLRERSKFTKPSIVRRTQVIKAAYKQKLIIGAIEK